MIRLSILLTAIALVFAGCGGGGSSGSESTTTADTTELQGVETNDHGTKTVSDEVEFELDDNYFAPTVMKGTPGQSVKLEMENEGKQEHNFSLPAQSIDQDVEAGEDAEVTVTIPQSGRVTFFCKYHRALGMSGALEAAG